MIKNLSLGAKIAGGFGVIILLSIILGGLAIFNMMSISVEAEMMAEEYMPEVIIANNIERFSLLTMFENRGYGLTEEQAYLDRGAAHLGEVKKYLAEASELAKNSKHLVALQGNVEETTAAVASYEKLVQETESIVNNMQTLRKTLDDSATTYMKNCQDFLKSQNDAMEREFSQGASQEALNERLRKITIINDIIDLGNDTRVKNFKSQAVRDPKIMEEALVNFDKMATKFSEIGDITRLQFNIDQLDAIKKAAESYKGAMEDMLKDYDRLNELNDLRTKEADIVLEKAKLVAVTGVDNTHEIADSALASLNGASWTMGIGLLVVLGIGIVFSVVITLSITKPVRQVISALESGSDQVSSASVQVSSSSQQMAEGASEQASSLEEISSTLEQMSSMTRQNAENAGQANGLATNARNAATDGNKAMENLSTAILEIKGSADETAKIVKTIDEIAFQTNLLALNAAVEAARAGEAGKGFAVVAEEVRNLAQRAGEAAKTTSDLIEQSQRNSENGVKASGDVAELLKSIVDISNNVSNLVDEVAHASDEQAQGITQVNNAVAQLDQLTQTNAANAEESSSASEELASQANELKSVVDTLVSIVESDKNAHTRLALSAGNGNGHRQRRALPSQSANAHKDVKPHMIKAKAKQVSPEEVIPLDDDDLSDF